MLKIGYHPPFWSVLSPVIRTVQTVHITVHHVPKCMSCYKAIVVITGKEHCFHDCIYIMSILLLWDLSTLYVMDHSWPLIYIYIYIYIYVFIYCIYLCTIPHIILKLVKVKQCSATVPKPFSKKKKKKKNDIGNFFS